MGLFGNPNKKVENLIKKLERQGANPEAYKTRKSCYNCRYYSSAGNCSFHNKMTHRAELCNNYLGK
jgi:hypothetical protein